MTWRMPLGQKMVISSAMSAPDYAEVQVEAGHGQEAGACGYIVGLGAAIACAICGGDEDARAYGVCIAAGSVLGHASLEAQDEPVVFAAAVEPEEGGALLETKLVAGAGARANKDRTRAVGADEVYVAVAVEVAFSQALAVFVVGGVEALSLAVEAGTAWVQYAVVHILDVEQIALRR